MSNDGNARPQQSGKNRKEIAKFGLPPASQHERRKKKLFPSRPALYRARAKAADRRARPQDRHRRPRTEGSCPRGPAMPARHTDLDGERRPYARNAVTAAIPVQDSWIELCGLMDNRVAECMPGPAIRLQPHPQGAAQFLEVRVIACASCLQRIEPPGGTGKSARTAPDEF